MNRLVALARSRVQDKGQTHWEGCERDHRECLIQRMADEIERLQADARRWRKFRSLDVQIAEGVWQALFKSPEAADAAIDSDSRRC